MIRFAILLLLPLLSSPAYACDFVVRDKINTSAMHLENCSVVYDIDEVRRVMSNEAQDLGSGYVTQVFESGHGCGWFETTVVLDCNSNSATWFSSREDCCDVEPPSAYQLLNNNVEGSAKTGSPMKIDQIFELAELQASHRARMVSEIPSKIDFEDKRFDMTCGCKLYYPEEYEATQ